MAPVRFAAFLLLGVAALVSGVAQRAVSQEKILIDPSKAKAFHGYPFGGLRWIISNGEAQAVVDLITKSVPIPYQLMAFVSEDKDEVPNAWADTLAGRRLIAFNTKFMGDIRAKAGNYWVVLSIAAHEVGHHAYKHIGNSTSVCDLKQTMELEADYYSGFALGKLGAKQDEATSGMRLLPSEGSCDHPMRDLRVAEITRAFKQATEGLPASPKRPPETAQANGIAAYDTRKNRDVFGNDLVWFNGISVEVCAQRCSEVQKCKGFSFDRWLAVCYLKSAIGESVLDPTSVIGVKKPTEIPKVSSTAELEMRTLRQKRFEEKPEVDEQAESREACQDRCFASIHCVAFTYREAGRRCQQFKEVAGPYRDEAATSGYKRQIGRIAGGGASPGSITIVKDQYFKSDGYLLKNNITQSQCESDCRGDRRCRAMEYDPPKKACRLYEKPEKGVPDKGTIIGYKS